MATMLTFGDSISCELPLNDYTLLAVDQQEHPALPDPAMAVREALASPTGYPPLPTATVPGDHVAIALDADVPRAAAILRGVIGAMLNSGVEPELITVVSIGGVEHFDELVKQLGDMGAEAVKFEQHDPDDEQSLAMVGVNSRGEPLRLNRTLAEADFVLPIGAGRLTKSEDAPAEKFGSLFPQFSSRETAARLQAAAASESAKARKQRSKEIDEAGWLLGVGMTVRVVPGPAGGVAAVLAGNPEVVSREAADRSRLIWERSANRQGDLVIATLVGNHHEQTWENLARALSAAAPLVEPGGAIVVCTELDEPPSGALNRLLDAVDFGEVQQELLRDDAVEAASALALARALDQGPVYLRSRLPADVVESLGMTPIHSDDELGRLAAGREHCVVIEEAQRIVPRLSNRNEL